MDSKKLGILLIGLGWLLGVWLIMSMIFGNIKVITIMLGIISVLWWWYLFLKDYIDTYIPQVINSYQANKSSIAKIFGKITQYLVSHPTRIAILIYIFLMRFSIQWSIDEWLFEKSIYQFMIVWISIIYISSYVILRLQLLWRPLAWLLLISTLLFSYPMVTTHYPDTSWMIIFLYFWIAALIFGLITIGNLMKRLLPKSSSLFITLLIIISIIWIVVVLPFFMDNWWVIVPWIFGIIILYYIISWVSSIIRNSKFQSSKTISNSQSEWLTYWSWVPGNRIEVRPKFLEEWYKIPQEKEHNNFFHRIFMKIIESININNLYHTGQYLFWISVVIIIRILTNSNYKENLLLIIVCILLWMIWYVLNSKKTSTEIRYNDDDFTPDKNQITSGELALSISDKFKKYEQNNSITNLPNNNSELNIYDDAIPTVPKNQDYQTKGSKVRSIIQSIAIIVLSWLIILSGLKIQSFTFILLGGLWVVYWIISIKKPYLLVCYVRWIIGVVLNIILSYIFLIPSLFNDYVNYWPSLLWVIVWFWILVLLYKKESHQERIWTVVILWSFSHLIYLMSLGW